MKKRSIIVLTLLAGCFTNSFAQKGEKTLTVEVSNEWTQNKTDEPIVIDLNNLKAGFNIKSATVWEGNKEILRSGVALRPKKIKSPGWRLLYIDVDGIRIDER